MGVWTDSVGRPFARAGTIFHELGHNLALNHGGNPTLWGKKYPLATGTTTYFEPNCKPNYLSSMSYLFQVHGLYKNDGSVYLDYSRAAHGLDTPPSINEVSLADGELG